LRQSDALACMLFNIALEKAVRDAGIGKRGTIYHTSVQVLAYAGDIDVIGQTTRAVKETFLELEKAAQEIGLTVNESKTKYMEITFKPNNMQYVIVNNYKFEKVNEFKYLGTLIKANNNLTQEINHRLLLANKCYYELKNNWDPTTLAFKPKVSYIKHS
jgi:sorting nexin-29